MTAEDLRGKWTEVETWRFAQTLLARDLVALRHTATDMETMRAVVEHETAFALVSRKLAGANLAYYEARDALERQPKPEPHMHTH